MHLTAEHSGLRPGLVSGFIDPTALNIVIISLVTLTLNISIMMLEWVNQANYTLNLGYQLPLPVNLLEHLCSNPWVASSSVVQAIEVPALLTRGSAAGRLIHPEHCWT